ncbi:MAG: Gfo/Idh/MocA family oxidoreductase [Capsulimonadaceae bacterium]|nr:Gfo/Idh/MocA family oxidoreductase [Capsulimonadaceae bacterium]
MDTEVDALRETEEKPVKPLNIAIIGCGGIAQTHINYLKKIPGVTIVAGADINPAALDRMKSAHGVTALYEDFNVMLKKEGAKIDAVSVCTPNGVHHDAAIAASQAGKHVICEKPMAMNAKQAQEMADAAKKAGKEFVIGFQHRYEPRSKVLRDMIADGVFGKILYVRAQALRRRGIPNWGVFGQKALQGGGPLIDIGVHILETAHSIIGTPKPVSATGNTFTFLGNKESSVVSQWAGWDWKTYTVEDFAAGMIRFDTGALLTLEASFVAHIDHDIFNLQIFGEKGGAIWDGTQIFTDFNDYMVNVTPPFIGKWDIWDYKIRHFVEVARDGRKNEAPAEHGVMVQKMLDGIYASAEAGHEVKID